jgi:Uma2 family endonuclease
MAVELLRRAFTVTEYHRMAEAGILTEDDRVELLEGEIVTMTPIGSRHAACVNRLTEAFAVRVVGRAIVSVQNPIQLGERSELQPELVLLQPRADFYASAHPGPGDVLLVVEVAETSAGVDRGVKIPLYARARIPEVWLVALAGESIEIYRRPTVQGYQGVQQIGRGGRVAPEAVPELEVDVDGILG